MSSLAPYLYPMKIFVENIHFPYFFFHLLTTRSQPTQPRVIPSFPRKDQGFLRFDRGQPVYHSVGWSIGFPPLRNHSLLLYFPRQPPLKYSKLTNSLYLDLGCQNMFHGRIKHMVVKFNFIRNLVKDGEVVVKTIHTSKNHVYKSNSSLEV